LTKKLTKYLIFSSVLIICLFIYKQFFVEKNTSKKTISKNNESNLENQNNLIKNLKYDVKFENGTTYNISAELSEIIDVNNQETVKMQKVTALIINEGSLPLIISSDYAVFNNITYNTSFDNDVTINYINNSIKSQKLFLDFQNSVVIIKEDIIYEGINGLGKADNIKINLKTKDIQIFMDNNDDKVKITSK
tara:strand:+ start:4218 stop:4793 length:576 start_codon:yes stop_codon:yes gene_type:complete